MPRSPRSPRTLPLAALLGAALAASSSPTPSQSCGSVAPLQQVAQDAIQQLGLPGLGLRVDDGGQTVFDAFYGSHSAGTVLPIASTTKTLSAAVLMTLVEDGTLTLSDTLGQWLPEYVGTPLAGITLRQCFSHTSGLPSQHPSLSDTSITLRDAARQIASVPLREAPGTAFRYGGVGMQVAGAICEVASGQPWQVLFATRIAQPLGLTQTDYEARGQTLNPHIGGGIRSTRDELMVFFDMLRNRGQHNGQRVLARASVEAMVHDETSGLPIRFTAHLRSVPYGLGMWLERRDVHGRTTVAMGAGATGCIGWVDLARDTAGVWTTESTSRDVYPYFDRALDVTAAALAPVGSRCVGRSTPLLCAAGLTLRATTWVRDGQLDFGFAIDGAPQSSVGALAIDGGPPTAGTPYYDLTAYLRLGQAGFETVLTDTQGKSLVALPIPTGLVGLTFTAQAAIVDPMGCGRSGLQATPAAALTVLP